MSCDDMWEGLGRRIIPPRELARMEARDEARAAVEEAYEHWQALRRIAVARGWRDMLPALDEVECMIPDPEEVE